jgi:Cu(I)/Ag(I) efflux system membrane fusion protein
LTRRETRIILLGLALGLIVAATIAVGFWLHVRRSTPESTATTFPVETTEKQHDGISNESSGAVQLSVEEQVKIGLQTITIQREIQSEEVLSIGRVEEAETSTAIISTGYGGRIEKLFVNFTGQPVKLGDPVATIAMTGPPTAKDDPAAPIRITVNATASGIVRARKATEGQFINAGDPLIELTDLKGAWVKASIFDADLSKIRLGVAATITSDALPQTKLSGVVTFIDTHSDPQTRTTPVRIEIENSGAKLKPGMIVQTSFHIGLGSMLTVPRSAVLDNGTEKSSTVARDNGAFESHKIQVADPIKDSYPSHCGIENRRQGYHEWVSSCGLPIQAHRWAYWNVRRVEILFRFSAGCNTPPAMASK